jgi:hypothetical protein
MNNLSALLYLDDDDDDDDDDEAISNKYGIHNNESHALTAEKIKPDDE